MERHHHHNREAAEITQCQTRFRHAAADSPVILDRHIAHRLEIAAGSGGILGPLPLCFNPPSTQRGLRCANAEILLSFLMKWIAACTLILAHGLGKCPWMGARGPSASACRPSSCGWRCVY